MIEESWIYNPIDILLRHEEEYRQDFDDIANMYVTSSGTGARIPLRQVARIVPEWQTGKIVRRNGVRTITVRSEAQMGSVLSVGLIFGMVLTLIIVPVMYYLSMKPSPKKLKRNITLSL